MDGDVLDQAGDIRPSIGIKSYFLPVFFLLFSPFGQAN